MAQFKPQYRRLLHIDRKIREGAHPNCSSLAEEWETSTRTILRDLDYLKDELGAPIAYDAIKHGFYYEDPAWFLPSVLLSEGDLLALLIGQQALNMYRGTPVARDIERIFSKLAELLPDRIAIGPEFIQARLSFFNAPSRPIDPEIWRVVLRALLHSTVLEIGYLSPAAAQPKPHLVRPYHAVNLEGEWYLLAYEERWQELRQFALSRIRKARLTGRIFAVPEDFDAEEVLRHRFGRYLHANGPAKPIQVRLLFEKTLALYVSEKIWHPKQKLRKRPGGRVELMLPVASTHDVESWVLSLGEFVRVLSPKNLREAIRARHRKAARA
jgi:proteasome accessory factor B